MKKLSISLLLVVLISIFGLGQGIDNLFEKYQAESDSDELTPYRLLMSSLALTIDNHDDPEVFVQSWRGQHQLVLTIEPVNQFILPAPLQKQLNNGEPLVLESVDRYSIHALLPNAQKVLSLSVPQEAKKANNESLQWVLTIVFYVGILLVIFIWLNPLIRHLRELSQSARMFGEGQLDRRIKPSSSSFIADIENEFNRMATRIETLVSDNKLLSSAVSHDLRTPLARLRFGIEAIRETTNPEKQKKYIQHLSNDINEMENLVSVLLNYARLDQNKVDLKMDPIDLEELIQHCIDALEPSAIKIQLIAESSNLVLGDCNFCTMLVNNLLDNGLKFAKQNIHISLIHKNSHLTLIVADDGPGIPAAQRQQLLKPFARGDTHQTSSGFGMGLAIVARIASWHHARLTVGSSTTLGGAEFRICFRKGIDS
jgi:two-component system OmpR family sensor kinase